MNTALAQGFEVIYADNDSIFTKRDGACREDFEALAREIARETALPITLDQHFKFLVLLKQESDPNLEATRRYYGKLTNGELYYRGIELRRHDCPAFLKKFETELMTILLDADSAGDVWMRQYKHALDYVIETCDLIRSGKVPLNELVISKNLRKPIYTYKSLFPHVVAAIQMAEKGKRLKYGEKIDFLYTDAEHRNPFRRVVPAAILDSRHRFFDREKYVQLALDVAETVLGVFGFSRGDLGLGAKPKDYIEEIKMERSREIVSELETLTWSGPE